jgi:transcription-repair coupling factor (superfamily II helicase)
LAAAAYRQKPCQVLVVTSTYDKALQWHARLTLNGAPASRVRLLPSGLSVLFEDASPETVALSDRIGAIKMLSRGEPGIVIATPQAALERTLSSDLLKESFLEIEEGVEADIDAMRRALVRLGYENAEPVRVPGQFSRRGGILDIFPMGFERPVRVEFFGDEVDSLREFDPMSQRSIRKVGRLEIAPSRETLFSEDLDALVSLLHRTLDFEAQGLEESAAERLREAVEGDIQALSSRAFFDRLDLYRPLLLPDAGCAIDLLGPDGLLILDEPLEIEAYASRSEEDLAQALAARMSRGEILQATAGDFVLPPDHLAQGPRTLSFSAMNGVPEWLRPAKSVDVGVNPLSGYAGQGTALTQAIRAWLDHEQCVVIGTDQPSRVKEMLKQVDLFPGDGLPPEISPGLWMVDGNQAGGFAWPDAGLALLTDQELFGVGRLKLPQRKFNDGVPLASVLDLKPGDFVVHISFGIGTYRGLVTREVDGIKREYLHIDYKEPDKLFVPADQLDRVQKYLSPGDVPPKVNRLTGGDWQKTVTKARESAREYARELIQIYAQRKLVTRPTFGPDTPWQGEMEHTFPWAETPSQLTAISEVKEDMETDYPMDRLVCGDVGFGKTEVAIRAAFKAAVAKRQVAVLCPTTILSEQHFRNFSERLGSFDVRLGLLNRFTHANEKRRVLEEVEKGDLDILIGTHALLNTSIKFKDLGLLVVDEEQKFGVKQKESLKKLRLNVDVLSMSATPIPRTLSMALMSIREMSVINDPPPGRLPVRTFVRPYAQEVVTEAILRELARGGQVYYVSHQVQGIHHIAEHLKKLIPSARIAVGHGQMHEKELEPVMVGFIKGEIDILVSTTIVENGLDIANANTLIVENSDRFGLSQLYQLRGRVGRSDRQAYAYFLFPGRKLLTEGASARLEALAQFNQLGSGYSLAVRDLQIRGAGDLLGAKQSGQMNAVGYDLYAQLIEAEVQFLKMYADGEKPEAMADPLAGLEPLPSVDLPVKAFIPESYVEEQGQRLWYYKRLMGCRSRDELREVAVEISDRYGVQPEEVANAVSVIDLRIRALALQIRLIELKQGVLSATFVSSFEMPPRLMTLIQKVKREASLSQEKLIWTVKGDPLNTCDDMLRTIESGLEQIEADRASLRSGR